MDELERILGEDEGLEPSSGFTRRVMDAVEQQQAPPPIPFPWLRILPACAGALVVIVAFAAHLAGDSPDSTPTRVVSGFWDHPLADKLGLALATLLGSLAVAVISLRLFAPSR
ncbi:hypothetical protein ABI59_17065 [Acidobacteria bacterium Mor1]|nr:hypothetical protein ABI59_17065 [Acidobacteria bacterium Mor1]